MLVQCTFVYPASPLSRLSLFLSLRTIPSTNLSLRHLPSIHLRAPSFGLFLRVRPSSPFPSPRPGFYRRSMLSYPTDNSIILHAKTASDVLAQSASHLCEQITSYRKTDFIFEERWLRFFSFPPSPYFFLFFLFFPHPRARYSTLPRSVSRSLVSSSSSFF